MFCAASQVHAGFDGMEKSSSNSAVRISNINTMLPGTASFPNRSRVEGAREPRGGNMVRRIVQITFVVISLLIVHSAIWAQSAGPIEGTVNDSTGTLVPHAKSNGHQSGRARK
jgi:hypothetical protein